MVSVADPLQAFVDAIRRGQIGALKGLGGFHLACLAENSDAVTELRRRKQRDEKPLAVMVRDVAAAAMLCEVSAAEAAVLQSAARPSCSYSAGLRRPGLPRVASVNLLGVLLPYSPVHHLLLDELRQPGADQRQSSDNDRQRRC
jgi:hydrogenase maturation protein HypF